MKQKIIYFTLGVVAASLVMFIYNEVKMYFFEKEYEAYLDDYEQKEFLEPEDEIVFNANELYNMSLYDENGKQVNINNDGNKIIFLNFWATWCRPCINEMPDIEKLYKRTKDQANFYLVTYEPVEKVKKFMEKKGFDFPVYSYKEKEKLPEYFQVNGGNIPDTYVIYNDQIKHRELGAAPWNSPKVDSLFTAIKLP